MFLAFGFLGLQLTQFYSNMGFLIEAKCSLNCKDKQNISKEIVSLEEHRCHHFFRCLLHLGTSLGCVALYHTTSCPSKPPRNLQMIGLSPNRLESRAEVATFTRDSLDTPLLSSVVFWTHHLKLCSQWKGKEKAAWKQSIPDQIHTA